MFEVIVPETRLFGFILSCVPLTFVSYFISFRFFIHLTLFTVVVLLLILFNLKFYRMGGAPSKTEPPVVVTSKIPLFCLKKIGPRHILVAGGGGESKTGVLNLMQVRSFCFPRQVPF